MKEYRGIIFNSVNVGLLNGELGEKVNELNIRTAVVTRKTKTEVKKYLKSLGLSVDAIIGGKDLNTHHKDFGKPHGDPMFVAAAKMHLDPSEVVVFGDYSGDRKACQAAGMLYCASLERLIGMLGSNPILSESPVDCSGFKVPTTGIIGAICGDIIGSAYEWHPTEDYGFDPFVRLTRFTDDSVATLAVSSWLMGDRSRESLVRTFLGVCNRHPNAGWGSGFKRWLRTPGHAPYQGCTNGAQMRVSPCGWAATSLEEALDLAKRSAEVSHNSDEGIEGAQSIAAAIYLLRTGHSKQEVKEYVERTFGYDLDMTVAEHREQHMKDYRCSISGPQAFRSWLEADTYEQAIRNAVNIQTDADTIADMAGALAAATPGMEVPQAWADRCFGMLDEELKNLFVEFSSSLG